jgi:DNA-binding HxlR family transcriptional regulator
MQSYRQFCPLSKAAEIICERWTPLVLRELLLGSTQFNALLRGLPGISPALLSRRLKLLEREGIVRVERSGRSTRYCLTDAGRELEAPLSGLAMWGYKWVRSDYRDEDLDPSYLMIDIHRSIQPELPGDVRLVLEIHFRSLGKAGESFWLVFEPGCEPDLCYLDPGFEPDVRLDCELRALTMIWLGDMTWSQALRTGQVSLSGPRKLTAMIPRWIGQSGLTSITPGRRAS